MSINQREVRGTEREKESRGVEGLRDRPHQNYHSSRTWYHAQPGWHSLPSKIWRSITSHSWDYFGHLVSLRPAVNTDVCIFYCFAPLRWTDGVGFSPRPPRRVDLREMSERRRSAAALSSRAHAFSVEALIGSNKKRKLRGWEEKELELSMESLGTDGEDPAHCLDMDPGQCADMHYTAQMSGSPLYHCRAMLTDESEHGSIFNDPTLDRACSCELHALMSMWSSLNPLRESALLQRCRTKRRLINPMVQACREPVTPVYCQRHHTTYASRKLLKGAQLHQQQIKWSNQVIRDFRLNMRWIIRRVCVSLRVGLCRFWLLLDLLVTERKQWVKAWGRVAAGTLCARTVTEAAARPRSVVLSSTGIE